MGKASRQQMTGLKHERRVNLAEKVSGKHGRARCWRDLRRICPHVGIFFHRDTAIKCKRRSGTCTEMEKEMKN